MTISNDRDLDLKEIAKLLNENNMAPRESEGEIIISTGPIGFRIECSIRTINIIPITPKFWVVLLTIGTIILSSLILKLLEFLGIFKLTGEWMAGILGGIGGATGFAAGNIFLLFNRTAKAEMMKIKALLM